MAYLATSSLARLVPPREGVNPFTKKPTTFHPAPGSATCPGEGSTESCSIRFQNGKLIVTGPTDRCLDSINELAAALGATAARHRRSRTTGNR